MFPAAIGHACLLVPEPQSTNCIGAHLLPFPACSFREKYRNILTKPVVSNICSGIQNVMAPDNFVP